MRDTKILKFPTYNKNLGFSYQAIAGLSSCEESRDCDELCAFNSFCFRAGFFFGGALLMQLLQYHFPRGIFS